MKRYLLLSAAMIGAASLSAEVEIPVYDNVIFYDGYAALPEDAEPEDCLMLKSYLKSKKLTDEQLAQIGEHLTLQVDIHARCDNYDRIGGVNLAFLPKGTETYTVTDNPEVDPLRIEIARFITPFMNKNKEPSTVSYKYQIDNISRVLRNPAYRDNYDIWVEFEVFGVPYVANQQIAGCAGCNDVFGGTLKFFTDDEPAAAAVTDVFLPITTRDGRPDKGMNNYSEDGCDKIGTCKKTFNFTLPKDIKSGRVVIIMSNHGANAGGEEYSRRKHIATLDKKRVVYQWTPGRETCEPFRVYNTQGNGIYGGSSLSDEEWQSFSNWCPGAPIPYQSFETGELAAGEHSIIIFVPDAVFRNNQGYFPVSIYIQGDTEGAEITAPVDYDTLVAGVDMVCDDYESAVDVQEGMIAISAPKAIDDISLFSISGEHLTTQMCNGASAYNLDMRAYPHGLYILSIAMGPRIEAHKLMY